LLLPQGIVMRSYPLKDGCRSEAERSERGLPVDAGFLY
jgi:hypothetical protein